MSRTVRATIVGTLGYHCDVDVRTSVDRQSSWAAEPSLANKTLCYTMLFIHRLLPSSQRCTCVAFDYFPFRASLDTVCIEFGCASDAEGAVMIPLQLDRWPANQI